MPIDIGQLYRTYGPMVFRRCRSLLGDSAQAGDIMHDVFVEVLRRQDQLDDRAPASLLLTIATNLSLNHLRNSSRRKTDLDSELLARHADGGADTRVESRALSSRIVRRLFARHPESTRDIAILHFVDGLTWEEVANETGMSVSGVRKRAARFVADAWSDGPRTASAA